MPRIDLITGFLGSGKTTFLKVYARKLLDAGRSIGILENDFGAVNVDMMLLKDLEGEQCELEMVAGGCDYDCHRRRFKTKLIAMGMVGYDTVLVEPSGIYDTDEFFDVLWEEPLDRWYRIGSVIAIVDAKLEENLSEEAEYLLVSQISRAGAVVLSRVQESSAEEIAQTIAHLNRALERFGCTRRFTMPEANGISPDGGLIAKDWAELTAADFDRLHSAGTQIGDHRKIPVDRENAFESLYYLHVGLSKEELTEAAAAVFADSACGRVFRIKGFLENRAEPAATAAVPAPWLQVNATREALHFDEADDGQEVLIVIGENLCEEVISRYFGKPAGVL